MKRLAIVSMVVALVAVIAAQTAFVNADSRQYAVYKASLQGQSGGAVKFVEDPAGDVEMHWDLSYGSPDRYVTPSAGNGPQLINGYLSVLPGRPPICVCPNADQSCICAIAPGGISNIELQRR